MRTSVPASSMEALHSCYQVLPQPCSERCLDDPRSAAFLGDLLVRTSGEETSPLGDVSTASLEGIVTQRSCAAVMLHLSVCGEHVFFYICKGSAFIMSMICNSLKQV